MRQIPVPQEIYRHFKGNLYQIVTVAEHSETGEQMVVYQALYGDFRIYARPLSMFMDKVDLQKYPDAGQEYRFERQGRKDSADVNDMVHPIQAEAAAQTVSGSDEKAKETAKETAIVTAPETLEVEGEIHLDPLVIEFLDASSYEQRMNILSALHHRITDDMINIMSIALDIEVKPGDIEERYAEFKGCLALMEKYECNRLR